MSTEFESALPRSTRPVGRTADHEPTTPVPRRWTSLFGLVWFGYWMANLVPLQLLLPQ